MISVHGASIIASLGSEDRVNSNDQLTKVEKQQTSLRTGIGEIWVDTLKLETKGQLPVRVNAEEVDPLVIDTFVFVKSLIYKREFETNPTILFKINV